MKELIPVTKNSINETETLTCDARALHEFMEVETRFADWFQRRVEKYGFVEGIDFLLLKNEKQKNGRGGHNQVDAILSIDMAKQIAMVENNEKGMEVRRYFIRCEQIAKEAGAVRATRTRHTSTEVNARSVATSLRMLARMKEVYPAEMCAIFAARAVTTLTGEELQPLLPPVQSSREGWLTATALGKRFNVSANAIGRLLKSTGLHGSDDPDHRHSQPVWDKSRFSNKEVISYIYNPDIVLPRLAETLPGEKETVQ